MTFERAAEIHDRAWSDYMKAFWRMRATPGKAPLKVQNAFWDASERVARAHAHLKDAEVRAGL